ncbi:MAG: iron ABC transporter permease [Phycisphaerales bacterium]|nr:iron ABC transporter permease [Phycisphaerales bacterium]
MGTPAGGGVECTDAAAPTESTEHVVEMRIPRTLLHALVVAGPLAVLLIVLAVPIRAIVLALRDALLAAPAAPTHPWRELTRWLVLLGNTATVAGVALALALSLGTALALLIARTDLYGRRLTRLLIGWAACTPLYVTATFALAALPGVHLSQSAAQCGVLYGLVYAPLATLLVAFSLRAIDGSLEESALLDATAGRVMLTVTLPLARGGLVAAGVVLLVLVVTDFTLTDLLAVRTYAEEAYSQYRLDGRQVGPLLTGLPLLAVLVVVVATCRRLLTALMEAAWARSALEACRFRLRGTRGVTSLVVLSGLLAVVLVLLGATAARIRQPGQLGETVAVVWPDVINSLWLGALAAGVIVLAGVGLAWRLAEGGAAAWLVGVAVIFLASLPGPVVGISLIGLLNHPAWPVDLYDSPLAVAIGYVVRFLPLGVVLLLPAALAVPRGLREAARVDGGDELDVHTRVVWPMMLPALPAVGVLLVILCLGDVGTATLLLAPGWDTAASRAFSLLHFGVYQDLAVLGLLTAAHALAAYIMLTLALRWRRGGEPGLTE